MKPLYIDNGVKSGGIVTVYSEDGLDSRVIVEDSIISNNNGSGFYFYRLSDVQFINSRLSNNQGSYGGAVAIKEKSKVGRNTAKIYYK